LQILRKKFAHSEFNQGKSLPKLNPIETDIGQKVEAYLDCTRVGAPQKTLGESNVKAINVYAMWTRAKSWPSTSLRSSRRHWRTFLRRQRRWHEDGRLLTALLP
jgi:hypothetical protein